MAAGTGIRVENEEEFRAWLDEKKPPQEICVALAARAALRALPLVATAHFPPAPEGARPFADLAAAVFRATALARVAATYPTRANELRAAADAAASAAGYAAYAAAYAAASAGYAADAAAYAAGYAAHASAAIASSFWQALSLDLQAIEAKARTHEFASWPLWPNNPPDVIPDYWRELGVKLAQSGGWRVWMR